ncbi:MAG: C39 family peptidase, partial [Anaerolinea sp.]|nr:C39 family peptidase [Anaerolinea sp.]
MDHGSHLHAPPRFVLWSIIGLFLLLIIAALGGFAYFSSGRLSTLIPYAAAGVFVVLFGIIGGVFLFRDRLPRLLWVWVTLTILVLVIAAAVGGVLIFRNNLPPRYQEQMITEVPFMSGFFRSLMPPTPAGGSLPTAQPGAGGINPLDLLGGGSPQVTEEATPAATAEATAEAVSLVLTPTPTLEPTDPPTAAPTVAPTAIPTLQPTEAAVMVAQENLTPVRGLSARMFGFTHVQQGWNNCGPANTTMVLSHYGWQGNQDDAAGWLKPVDEDKNVSPTEIVSFINTQTGVRAVTRIGGDMELLKQLIYNNIPVVIETSYAPEGYDWIGHYQTVVGYDDNAGVFYIYDSYLGTGIAGEGLPEPYSEFDRGWRDFNRVFIAVYDQPRESLVTELLGERADVNRAAEIALETAQEEARIDRRDKFAWFNIGSSYTRLGMYQEAANAYDVARQLDLPFRITWYQFGP